MTKQALSQNQEKKSKIKKKNYLRFSEYYDMQESLDKIYMDSKQGKRFLNLIEKITSPNNILLAYRTIKKNDGSATAGVDGKTIEDIENWTPNKMIFYVTNRLNNYIPHPVRRVEIPKNNDPTKKRPLGIPTIGDRIIQQCIKQILEPICEAKFYEHSYGFRPNRSTHHAIARCYTLAQKSNYHYVVDVDIKGFFDNVNHGKLLKQMWNIGIQDKHLICVISKMLKAPIDGIGIPDKGTPQGGILSPLLSNIVLNELDWWIASQWHCFPAWNKKHEQVRKRTNKKGEKFIEIDKSHKYRAMRSTKLKEMFIVRYADDFKIFCKSYNSAKRIYKAVKSWLKERLGLDVSEEKSKITNLKKHYTEFLGFKFKVWEKEKKNEWVITSHIKDGAIKKIAEGIKGKIKYIQKDMSIKAINQYNSTVLSYQQYYNVASEITDDMGKVAYKLNTVLFNRLKNLGKQKYPSEVEKLARTYQKFYEDYNYKLWVVAGKPLFPIKAVTNKAPLNFSQDICNYTVKGRKKIHENISSVDMNTVKYMMNNPIINATTEFNDNRISKYIAQKGRCSITGLPLEIGNMEVHHKKPKFMGGTDKYQNLEFINGYAHKLIHAVNSSIIKKYLDKIGIISKKVIEKINELRKLV